MTIADHYWIVGGDETQFYSSAAAAYVLPPLPPGWQLVPPEPVPEILPDMPTRIATEMELWEVLAEQYPQGLPQGYPQAQQALIEAQPQLVIDYDHENRLREQEGLPPLSLDQFRIYLLELQNA